MNELGKLYLLHDQKIRDVPEQKKSDSLYAKERYKAMLGKGELGAQKTSIRRGQVLACATTQKANGTQ
jgi:hypothetical protein